MSWTRSLHAAGSLAAVCKRSYASFTSIPGDVRQSLMKFVGGKIDLTVDKSLGIAKICINHPEKANAFTGQMMVELNDVVEVLGQDTGLKAVLIHGAGSTFCAGADLGFVRQNLAPSLGLRMCQWMQQVTLRLQQLPLVTVALLHGPALGGGAELAIMCDLRIVNPTARLQFVHGRMGLVPGWGGGSRLVRLVGPSHALEMLCRGHGLGARELLASCLANAELPSSSEPVSDALNWVQELVSTSAPGIVQAMKVVVKNADKMTLEQSLEAEREQFGKVWGGPVHREALAKFERK